MSPKLRPKPVTRTERSPSTGAIGGYPRPARAPVGRSLDSWWPPLICLLLALAVWGVFGQTRNYGFVNYDDLDYVSGNPHISQGLSWVTIGWAFTHRNGAEWWPLTAISHMLDFELYGLHPGGHHLTNILLHAATAILLFLLLRKMTGALWASAFAAAVFAIHPLRVESVAWVTERKDVLSGLFFVLTVGAYVRYVSGVKSQASVSQHGFWLPFNRHSSLYSWLALIFFALGLLSKTMLVTVPFLLLLLDLWPLNRLKLRGQTEIAANEHKDGCGRGFWQLAVEKIPFLLLAAAACVGTILAQQGAIRAAEGCSFPWRMGNALVAYVTYIGQMFYPVGLAAFYPHPGNQLPIWKIGVSTLVLLIISAGVMADWRRRPYLLVGWLWYLGMLLPVIGLLQVGGQSHADRYTYLPQIGLYILITWGCVDLCRGWRHGRVLLQTAAIVILATLIIVAHGQTRYWRDSVSLWTHILACTSANPSAHMNLGEALNAQGQWDRAVEQYEQALEIQPDLYQARINLGMTLAAQGKLDEAIQQYKQVLNVEPDLFEAHNNLGVALTAQGRLEEAVQECKRALELKPDDGNAHYNLGVALAAQGNLDEAIQQYGRAVQLKPDDWEAQNNLGVALATQERWNEAIPHYERTLQLKPDYAAAHYNLGIALAAQGRLNAAIQHQQQALNLATAQNNAALAEEIRQHLESDQQKLLRPQAP